MLKFSHNQVFSTLLFFLFVIQSSGQSKSTKQLVPKLPKVFKKTFVLIPENVNTEESSYSIDATFFISKYEVSNAEYSAFLNSMNNSNKSTDEIEVDTSNWEKPKHYNCPYSQHYHTHPAFANYPVVNITHEAAKEYCKWLEQKLNAENKTDYTFKVSLPSRVEWMYAASGGRKQVPYSWGGPFMRNFRGQYLCNFNSLSSENLHFNAELQKIEILPADNLGIASSLSDNADICAPVNSYFPSLLGLHNMNGNVAEMVLENDIVVGGSWRSYGYDVRNESTKKYEGSDIDVGFRPIITFTKKS